MSTTAALALLLGLVVAPTMVARAFVTPYPDKAAMFGFIGALALLGAVALVAMAVRAGLR